MRVEVPLNILPHLVIVSFVSLTLLGFAFWALIELDTEINKFHKEIEDERDM